MRILLPTVSAIAGALVINDLVGCTVGDGRGMSACVLPGHTDYPFCNTSLSIDERVKDLLGRIHIEDKPNLLTARGCRDCKHDGSSQRRDLGQPGHQQALDYLGVPEYYWGTNCIHSAQMHNCTEDGRCVTSFPSGPSMAATFNTELVQKVAGVISTEVRAAFNAKNWIDDGANGVGLDCWAPVLNLNRDPRWGRHGEGGAEDPKLMSDIGVAWTKGLQEGEDSRFVKIAITLKHFVANSVEGSWLPNGTWSPVGPINRHTIDVNLSNHTLADYYFRPFKESIKAGAKGVMCAYNSVNGVPMCLSEDMRNARETWGFDGYVTSDSDSVDDAYNTHHYTANLSQATGMALHSGGCDIDSGDTYYQNIESALDEGFMQQEDLDRALFNTFRVRFELGLFDPIEDQPYWQISLGDIASPVATVINKMAAQQSLVLLQNNGVLPLTPQQHSIAVVGPHALATHSLIQANTGRVCPTKNSTTEEVDFDCVETPYDAIKKYNSQSGNVSTFVSEGCTIAQPTNVSNVAAAVATAEGADVVILGLGIAECGGYLGDPTYPLRNCGDTTEYAQFVEAESHDRPTLGLPPAQLALAQAVIGLKKPTVVFFLNGGMVAPPSFMLQADNVAIIEAFYPGKEGADTLANAIFGFTNTWGRLPYTVYDESWATSRLEDGSYRHNMLDHDVADTQSTYRYLNPEETPVLFPFGFGLSLSRFELALSQEPGTAIHTDGSDSTNITVSASNAGSVDGDVVVQVYMQPPAEYLEYLHNITTVHVQNSDIKGPRRALIAYSRLSDIVAGQDASTVFQLDASDFLMANTAGDLVSAPGNYTITVETGSSKDDPKQVLSFSLQIDGDVVVHEKFPY